MRIPFPIGKTPEAYVGADTASGGTAPLPAASAQEIVGKRRWTEQRDGSVSLVREFYIYDEDDEQLARLVGPQLGDTWAGHLVLVRRDLQAEIDANGHHSQRWHLVVEYERDPSAGAGGSIDAEHETLSTSMETEHISQVESDADQLHYGPDETLADGTTVGPSSVGPLIGLQGDGTVEGVDVEYPVGELVVVRFRDSMRVDQFRGWMQLLRKTNRKAFWGFGPEELRLTRIIPEYQRHIKKWKFTYRFAFRANIDLDVTLIDGTTVTAEKRGHRYLWYTLSRKATEGGGKWLHIAKVYPTTDFDALNLGDPRSLTESA
jgi:hypothetical protein